MKIEEIINRLQNAYPGDQIDVIDLTGTEDHYEVCIESKRFSGLTRIQQHQQVMSAFSDELRSGEVHALSIKTKIKS